MNWIARTFQKIIETSTTPPQLKPFPVWLMLGPRQVGKSSLLKRLGPTRQYINLDDPQTRLLATSDPITFGRSLTAPLIIDEIQYAPQLLSAVKLLADATQESGAIWLTGSQSFEVMHGVRESLAGRVALLNLFGLSNEEKGTHDSDIFESIWESTFPRIFPHPTGETWDTFLASYVTTYIERDVRELLGVQKRREFEVFVKLCALRTGQRVNFDELGRDAGVSGVTAKEWLSILEDSFLIKLLHPYHSNRTKRLVKQPKLYFLDAGLAAYLAGWKTPEMLRLGAMRGAAYETHLFGEILRFFKHRALEAEISYFATKDNEEIDFMVEHRGAVFPIEAKVGDVRGADLVKLEKFAEPSWRPGRVITPAADPKQVLPVLRAEGWSISGPGEFEFMLATSYSASKRSP